MNVFAGRNVLLASMMVLKRANMYGRLSPVSIGDILFYHRVARRECRRPSWWRGICVEMINVGKATRIALRSRKIISAHFD
jgi:hypothetical protein